MISEETPWLTVEEFVARYKFTAKTAKVHVMFLARAGKIPGAKKKNGKWRFHQDLCDKWDENK